MHAITSRPSSAEGGTREGLRFRVRKRSSIGNGGRLQSSKPWWVGSVGGSRRMNADLSVVHVVSNLHKFVLTSIASHPPASCDRATVWTFGPLPRVLFRTWRSTSCGRVALAANPNEVSETASPTSPRHSSRREGEHEKASSLVQPAHHSPQLHTTPVPFFRA